MVHHCWEARIMTRPIRPPGNTAARGTESSRRPAVGPIPGRGQPVAPKVGNLNRNPRPAGSGPPGTHWRAQSPPIGMPAITRMTGRSRKIPPRHPIRRTGPRMARQRGLSGSRRKNPPCPACPLVLPISRQAIISGCCAPGKFGWVAKGAACVGFRASLPHYAAAGP